MKPGLKHLKRLCLAAAMCASLAIHARGAALSKSDEAFLDDLERRSCEFFLRESSPANGLVPDRVNTNGGMRQDSCSIAGGGFLLSALCIADSRGWVPHAEAKERVRTILRFAVDRLPHERGFLYHFVNFEDGSRHGGSEVSPIDTSLFLCGALTARTHFGDPGISNLATRFYERIDWPWMLNGGDTLALGWKPGFGFSGHRWHGYAEHMAMYLLGIGSPTHPLPVSCWHAWRREPVGSYAGRTFIMYPPLFVHQYAHAFVDFRNLTDDYCDYFQNSVLATLAQRQMCIDMHAQFPGYGPDFWGISASESAHGYRSWGGPMPTHDIDGTLVPCAAGGSIPFAPRECIATLRAMKAKFDGRIWSRYGFIDAFNPNNDWTSPNVLAIDAGITLVMIENFRTGLIWDNFMANPELGRAMQLAGFRPAPLLPANTSLLGTGEHRAPARRKEPRSAAAHHLPLPERNWDWQTIDAGNARESVFDGDDKISARFAFAWDTNALHIRIAVTDPEIVLGDKVELYIDPGNDTFSWGDYRDYLYQFSVTNQCVEALGRAVPNRVTVLATNDGYRVLAAIPWNLMSATPRPGQRIGVSVVVYSVSAREEPAVKLNWHWREENDGSIHLGTITLDGNEPRTTNPPSPRENAHEKTKTGHPPSEI